MAMFNTSSYVITRGYLIFSYIFIYVSIPPGFTSYIPRKSPDIAIFFHHSTVTASQEFYDGNNALAAVDKGGQVGRWSSESMGPVSVGDELFTQ